ncbi:MAG: peptide ABC transporter substrate-binding protein [Clostridia bacterium]|nr:peptide ABC transporter substrate-binding protein [Clostridia bacterium]
MTESKGYYRKKNLKKYIFFMLILSMSLSVSSCSLFKQDNSKKNEDKGAELTNNFDIIDTGPVRGGVLRLFSTMPDTFNPLLTHNVFVQDYLNFVYESLVKLDKTGKATPLLCKGWDISPDGLTWTFYLRDHILWHDNMPLTAEDVEYSLQTILSIQDNVYRKNFENNLPTFSVVDPLTFRMVLKKPDSFAADLMNFPVVPKHHFFGKELGQELNKQIPVGTGPFKFLSYSQNEKNIKFIVNDNWWRKISEKDYNELPYIAEVEVKIYDNIKEMASAFQERDIDAAFLETGGAGRYGDRADVILKRYVSNQYEFLAFNLNKHLLKDKAVRQAMSYAIDKVKIIERFLPGDAVPADIPVVPGTWLYDTNTVAHESDKNKAREILVQNGWKENNGIMYKYGNYLNFEILVNEDNKLRLKVAQAISDQLKEIGINLQIKSVKWEEEMQLLRNKRFDMAFLGCTVPSVPDISFLYASGEIPTGRNIAGFKNAEVDTYLAEIKTILDNKSKKASFFNMKTIIDEEVPYIGLYFYNDSILVSKRVRGEISPNRWDKFGDLTRWYIPLR